MSEDRVAQQLYAWLEEAVELRFGPAQDPAGALAIPAYELGPSAFASALIRARQRADRIEELLSKAKRVQARLRSDARDAEHEAEDAVDKNLAEGAASRAEYSLGVERKAQANLKSFDQLRAARQAEKRQRVADEVVEALKDLHFGLSGWRADVRDILRSYQLESNLER